MGDLEKCLVLDQSDDKSHTSKQNKSIYRRGGLKENPRNGLGVKDYGGQSSWRFPLVPAYK